MLISYCLPQQVLSNDELEVLFNSPEWSASNIYRKTGIAKRHVVTNELVSDLAIGSAEKLFSEFGIDRNSVDFLLLCTQSPDYFLPPTSCIVHERLSLPSRAGAFDFNLGCSGYIYGLGIAKSLILSRMVRNVLLITSETYTRYIHPMDRSTRTIFGDGAAATLVDCTSVDKIGEFVLYTDGSGAQNLIVPAGGHARKCDEATKEEFTDKSGNIRSLGNLYMNGPKIFAFTMDLVPRIIFDVLEKNAMSMSDIDYVVFHQANRFILESLREKMDLPREKFCIDIEEMGNTVSSTIPIALRRAIDAKRITEGRSVLLVGFGVGYSAGGTIIKT